MVVITKEGKYFAVKKGANLGILCVIFSFLLGKSYICPYNHLLFSMNTENEEEFDWASHLKAYLRTDEETNIEIAFQFLTSLGLPDDAELQELLRSTDMNVSYCLKHEVIEPIREVTKLDLHTWNVEDILEKVPQLTLLQELNLAQCNIKKLPRDFANLEQLRVLNLAFNKVGELPQDFKRLAQLTHLDLERNPISALPEGFWGLHKMQSLSLEDTKLASIEGIGNMKDLEELDLRDSHIASLPAEVGELTKLKILKIARSRIKSLPTELQKLQNLELLYIGGIEGLSLPEWVLELKNLKEISVSRHQLSEALEQKLRESMPDLEIKF